MIYIVTFFLISFFVVHFDINKQGRNYDKVCFFFIMLYLILMMGLRYRVGIDTLNYMELYDEKPDLFSLSYFDFSTAPEDPFYIILCAIAKTIGDDFFWIQLLQMSIVNVSVFLFFYRYCLKKYTAVLLYYIITYFYFSTEIMRESLAIACFLFSFGFLYEKKWWKYYLCAVAAFLFHSSAFFVFFIPCFMNLKFNRYFVGILVGFVFLCIFYSNYIGDLALFLAFTERMLQKTEKYFLDERFFPSVNLLIYQIGSFFILPLCLYAYFRKRISDIRKYDSMMCLYMLISTMSIFFSISSRFRNYLICIYIMILADIAGYILCTQKKNKLLKLSVFFFLATFPSISGLFISPFSKYDSTIKNYHEWYPYHSIWDPQKERKREDYWHWQFSHK